MLQPLILLIVLIILNAIFASAEIAVISMNTSKLKNMSLKGNKRAKRLLMLTSQPARFLATIQVAITVAGLLQSAFAAENFAGPLVKVLVQKGVTVNPEVLKTVSIVVITLVLAYFNLVFGELVPKRVAMKKSETLALGMANMLYAVSKAFAPIVWILTASTNGILRLFGMNPDEQGDEVTEEENEMIQNVFELNDTNVEEICTHRRDVIWLDLSDDDTVWEEMIHNNRHTLYPVCDRKPDDIVGVLDTRDYFRAEDKSREKIMKVAVKEPFCVPEVMNANVLFDKMKEQHNYFSVIIDEYGSMSGIVTVHDLVETLVGDLDEEDEEVKELIVNMGDGQWVIQGAAPLEDVSDALGRKFPTDVNDTFNGYLCGELGRVPSDDESFCFETEDMSIEVHRVKNRMVEEATVRFRE